MTPDISHAHPPVKLRYIVAFLIAAYLLVGTLDYAWARVTQLILLDNSSRFADGDECERATGRRPDFTVNRQDRIKEPYHHRTCGWQQ